MCGLNILDEKIPDWKTEQQFDCSYREKNTMNNPGT